MNEPAEDNDILASPTCTTILPLLSRDRAERLQTRCKVENESMRFCLFAVTLVPVGLLVEVHDV